MDEKPDEARTDGSIAVRDSAREWHRLQLAALAFVGLCGVLEGDSGRTLPVWLQTLSGLLLLGSLAVAALGVLIVATVAWPIVAQPPAAGTAARRLRLGIGLTFVAVTLAALASTANWWPDRGVTVEVSTDSGSACGQLVDSRDGWVELDVDGSVVRLPLDQLLSMRTLAACD